MQQNRMTILVAFVSLSLLVTGCAKEAEPTASGSTGSGTSAQPPAVSAKTPEMTSVDFVKDIKPVTDEFCIKCHSGDKPADGFDLAKSMSDPDTAAMKAAMQKMIHNVEGGKMPPPKGKPLPDDVRKKLVENLKALAG